MGGQAKSLSQPVFLARLTDFNGTADGKDPLRRSGPAGSRWRGGGPAAGKGPPPRSRSDEGVLHTPPVAGLLRAGDALRDEVHAVHAVGDVRVQAVRVVELLPGRPPGHVVVGRG